MPRLWYGTSAPSYESKRAKSLIHPFAVKGYSGMTINPYQGCQHRCSYCYATYQWSPEFYDRVYAKSNAPEILEQELQLWKGKTIGPVMVASATDAYQPAELKYGLTRRCIQVLQKYGVPYYVFTKSAIIDRDLDLHKRYSYNCFVVWSITTANERVRRIVEPGTPSIQRTFAVIKRFADAGIPCGVNIDPILPLVTDTDEEIDLLLALCGKAGVKHIFGEVLRLRNDIWDRIKLTIKLLGINRGEEQYREIYKIVEPLSAKSYISCNSEYAKKLYGILYEKVRSAGMHFGFPDHIRPQQINRASSSTGQTTILSFTLPPSEPT